MNFLKQVPSGVRFLPEAASAFDVDDELNRDPDIDEFCEFEDGSLCREDHTFKKLHGIYSRIIDGLGQSEAHSVSLEPVKNIFKNVWKAVERSHTNVLKLQKKDHVLSVCYLKLYERCSVILISKTKLRHEIG